MTDPEQGREDRTRGSMNVGPHRTYLRLLRGEITAERYVAILMRYIRTSGCP